MKEMKIIGNDYITIDFDLADGSKVYTFLKNIVSWKDNPNGGCDFKLIDGTTVIDKDSTAKGFHDAVNEVIGNTARKPI